MTAPFLREWLADEVRRGQHEESIALHPRARTRRAAERVPYARGEVYRLRAKEGDLELRSPISGGGRGRRRAAANPPQPRARASRAQRAAEAKASFQRYLELDPQAPDAAMIKTYLEEST